MSQLLDYTKKNRKFEKKIDKLFLAQICLKRIMTKKSRKKSKIIFGSDLSKTNNERPFRLHQKIDKNREKKSKIYFRLNQKN